MSMRPDAPSTPAPQGEKCAHAPERPDKQPAGSWGGEVYLVRDVDDYVRRAESALRVVREERDRTQELLDESNTERWANETAAKYWKGRHGAEVKRWCEAVAALARERESRKQAEAERQAVEGALEYAIDYLAGGRSLTEKPLAEIKKRLLSKPVQEPAERERGK